MRDPMLRPAAGCVLAFLSSPLLLWPETFLAPLSLPSLASPAMPAPRPVVAPAAAGETAFVARVIDGDTIDVTIDGRHDRVRLIGIDAPEKRTEERPAEPFAKEATAFARRLARGRTVTLAADPGREDRDRYGRLLRYVFLPDGRCLNLELVCQGYARAYTRFRHARQREFRACEKEARAQGRGMWGRR
jgi:micrococcal nuclease